MTKKVDGVDHKAVGKNVEFTYQMTVTNTGETDLKDVAVKDEAEDGVTFIKASHGTVYGRSWTYTIPELKKGESKNFTITAKVPEYKSGYIKNTVCVDAPTVPGNPDDCDDATVEVPPTPETPMIEVCDLESKTIITIKEDAFDQDKHSTNPKDCEETPVPPTPEAPKELPKTGLNNPLMNAVALSALVGSVIAYALSRRAI